MVERLVSLSVGIMLSTSLLHALPEAFESAFVEQDERLKQLLSETKDLERSFLEWWGEEGSEKREVAQKEFVQQLERDPLYAQDKPVEKHHLLETIRRLDYD